MVIILAAGRGTRLHPYTEDRPKCLALLAGQSLVERQLDTLHAAGLNNIWAATGYRQEMLDLPGLQLIHNPDWADTNMVESLFAAEASFGDDLIISYGDIIYQQTVLQPLLDSPHDISVIIDTDWQSYWAVRCDDPLSDAESLRLDGDGRIVDIGKPVKSLDDPMGQYIGLMRFRGNGITQLRRAYAGLGDIPRPWMDKRPLRQAYMTDLLMELILLGVNVHGVPVAGDWLEIDTPEDLAFAEMAMTENGIDRDRAINSRINTK
jgi:choline kinase